MKGELLSGGLLPQSPIEKALNYNLRRWRSLNAYLCDGILEVDNNLVKNAISHSALGRKNYLFAGSNKAVLRATSFIHSLLLVKNPYQWLKYVLENILEPKLQNSLNSSHRTLRKT